jgi:hypothetical protein
MSSVPSFLRPAPPGLAFPGLVLPGLALMALLTVGPAAAPQSVAWTFGPNALTSSDEGGRSIALLRDGVSPGHHALVVGAPHDTDGQTTGKVWVVDAEDPAVIVHQDVTAPGDELGTAVTAVPDVNGDGREDYAASVPAADFPNLNVGGFYIYSGATGAILRSVHGSKVGVFLGDTLAGIDDVNGDGAGDLLVGAPRADGPGGAVVDPDRGYVALYSGKTGALLKEWNGTADGDRLGAGLAGLGDLDYDGVTEFAIGVPGAEVGAPFAIVNAGRCDVYRGDTWTLLVTVGGGGGNEGLGSSISALGDRDEDGALEFAAGGPGWSDGKGRVRVYEGVQATLQATVTGLSSSQVADRFGTALAPGGDVDHDGHDDLLVTASREGTGLAGYAQVISGADWSVLGNTIFGPSNSGFGSNVAGGLDVTGDGWTDACFGLPDADTYGSNAGAVRCYRFITEQENLGFQGPGPTTLAVYGTPLHSGGHVDMVVAGLPPLAPTWFIASVGTLGAPFKGGVLVPHPGQGLVFMLHASLTGELSMLGLPGGGGPFDVIVQALAPTASAPKGWWMSNAVKLEFLP